MEGSDLSPTYLSTDATAEPVDSEPYTPFQADPTTLPYDSDIIDPSLLTSTSSSALISPQHISPANYLQVSGYSFAPDADVFFDCGCTTLHVPSPADPFLLPIRPRGFSLHANTLRLDFECVLSALLRNCLHLGIPKSQFCADEAESLFYRPVSASLEDTYPVDHEAERLVESTLTLFRTVKHDLRPLSSQITESHHPYIDVLPFRDLRENLVAMQGQIDEDELLHDWFNQATCWGGAKGSRGEGMPWDGRNWEVTDDFLRKWRAVIGGDEGELARGSRWWRDMRGDRIEEVL
jgi:hypothetical protein